MSERSASTAVRTRCPPSTDFEGGHRRAWEPRWVRQMCHRWRAGSLGSEAGCSAGKPSNSGRSRTSHTWVPTGALFQSPTEFQKQAIGLGRISLAAEPNAEASDCLGLARAERRPYFSSESSGDSADSITVFRVAYTAPPSSTVVPAMWRARSETMLGCFRRSAPGDGRARAHAIAAGSPIALPGRKHAMNAEGMPSALSQDLADQPYLCSASSPRRAAGLGV